MSKSGNPVSRVVLRCASALFAAVLLVHSGGSAWAFLDNSWIRPGQAAQPQDIELKPARIVVLVDESGSISPDDMAREQDAASIIGQSELSRKSTVSVVGFGDDNGHGQAVDVVCSKVTVAGNAETEQIAQCVRALHKRTPEQGAGTDHAEALGQALNDLGDSAPGDGPKVVFLLTDGVLDVSDSPEYGAGATAQQRNDAAHEKLRGELTTARDRGVQVWPLGFGEADKTALDEFAAGGYQGGCGPDAPKPSATVVASSRDVTAALLKEFSAGRCVGIGQLNDNQIGSGNDLEVTLTVPAIATDGAFVVVKHDGRVAVEYQDPDGKPVPKSGQTSSGKFEVSGASGAVEVLRVTDPEPGQWKVRVTVPGDVPPQDVLTAVTWLGAAQARINLDPPQPAEGQPVLVTVSAVLRGGKTVSQPDLLRGLSFTAEVTGDGLPTQPIALNDNGQDPDAAVDGNYTGRFTLPASAKGAITVHGRVSGIGISAADATATTRFQPGAPKVLVAATLPVRITLGSDATAQVSVTNNTGQRHRLRIEVQPDDGAPITIPAADAAREVDPGVSRFPVRLAVGGDRAGSVRGLLRVVDDADGTVYRQLPFAVDVQEPFPWLRWALATAAALALAAAGVGLWLRRRAREVRGLVVTAARGDHRVSLPTGARRATAFRFTVDPTAQVPRLDNALPGDPTAFTLTRSKAGLRLATPRNEVLLTQLDEPTEVGDDLRIQISRDPQLHPDPIEPPPPGADPGADPEAGGGFQEQPSTRDPYL